MTPSARLQTAIELVGEIESTSRPADAVANALFRSRRFIGSGDRRAISELVWPILRARYRLGWWLGVDASPRLLVASMLLFSGWTRTAVEAAFDGARFAPAALTAEETGRLARLAGKALDQSSMPLSVRLEVPAWMIDRLRNRFGARMETELLALREEASLDLRVNLLKTDRDSAQAALAREGITALPTPLSAWGLRVAGRPPITSGPAFSTGLVEIQDEGSQLIAGFVGAGPDMRVADFCAGAGGKALAIAMMMRNRGHIIACDVSAARLDQATRRLRRAGVHNVERRLLTAGDKWIKRAASGFDRVLVDAPCSGSGTWRRNPDSRLRSTPEDLNELLVKQATILDQAARLVRRSGQLIYATCSLLTEENETQLSAFVSRHPQFVLTRQLSLTPARDGTDGFYAAALERVA